ncbi:MAG: prolipoprotein diacylglyceryl transferase family protein [Dehalococcoidia bacterium]
MTDVLSLLTITIGWDPTIGDFGAFQLTWHGIFTAVGIAMGVYLAVLLGRREGFTEDDGYSIALVAVPSGIIGARALWIIENHERLDGWTDWFRVNEGGISIYGAIIGGIIGAVIYGLIRRLPVTRGLDAAVFGALLGMAVGRLGDLINGEHVGKATDLPWGVEYTHPESPAYQFGATHPATTYEMLGDLLIMGVLAFVFMWFWKSRPGITFFAGVVIYSAMRFGLSYLRIDSGINCPNNVGCPDHIIKDWMTFPQVVSTCTFAIGVLGLAWSFLRKPQETPEPAPAVEAGAQSQARPRQA